MNHETGPAAREPSDLLVVLLPAYNEARNIGGVISGIQEVMPDARILVVDDGSRDGTAAIASTAGATVLPLPGNCGYGVALQTGYKYAQRLGATYLAQMDADGQHDAASLPIILKPVMDDACDICLGSRFLEGATYRVPLARRAGMYLFRRVATWLMGQTITDPTSGLQAMNAKVLGFFCRDSFPVDYPDTDVLIFLHRHRFRVLERPARMRENPGGGTIHTGAKPLYYVFKMALSIPMNLLRRETL